MAVDCFLFYSSPIGPIFIRGNKEAVTEICFSNREIENSDSPFEVLIEAALQLKEYFKREREKFDVPLYPEGTEYQQKVWQELRNTGYGEIKSYRDIASLLGKPGGGRAVGSANGQNPIAIMIPCHRIIGSNGKLTGYAGGIERKKWLLQHEGAVIKNNAQGLLFQ